MRKINKVECTPGGIESRVLNFRSSNRGEGGYIVRLNGTSDFGDFNLGNPVDVRNETRVPHIALTYRLSQSRRSAGLNHQVLTTANLLSYVTLFVLTIIVKHDNCKAMHDDLK